MEKPVLRSLNIPELLDKALQLYKQHAMLLLSIFAVILIPSSIISSISIYYLGDSRLVDVFLKFFLSTLAELACLFAIAEFYLGREVTLQSAFKSGAKSYWSRMGMSLLIGLAMIPVVIIATVLSLSVVGLIILIPVIMFFSTRWSLGTCAIVFEGVGAVKGLERSWELTNGHFWRVFGTSFAAGLLTSLLSTLPSLLVSFLFEQALSVSPKVTLIATTLVGQFTTIIAAPLSVGVIVLIYYDLRIRKEGFDLEFMSSGTLDKVEIA